MTSHRRIATSNAMGWSSNTLNELSEQFVNACAPDMVVLDIGCAHGVATLPALDRGAIVHAVDPDHLETLPNSDRLILHRGKFPNEPKLPEASLDLAHASNVFHFLTGRQLELAAAKLFWLLKPGGRAYIIAATPFMAPFAAAIPAFERASAAGEPFPGYIPNTRAVSTHRLLSQLPKSILLLDDATLTRVLTTAGLLIDHCAYLRRRDLPRSLHYDGRENVSVIATRP